MNIARWARESVTRIRSNGLRDGGRESLRLVYHKGLQFVSQLRSPGTPIYEQDWDLLVILDACRHDLMGEVADEYEFIDQVGEFRSLDSMTRAWMQKTFTPEYADEMSRTAYICGNPFSHEVLDESDFNQLDEVWKYAWEDPGSVPPRAVTDRAVQTVRETEADRVIVHYMQPHCPFLSQPDLTRGKKLDAFGDQAWRSVWEKLRDGDLPLDRVWENYRENLRLGLEEVGLLLENVDAERAIITSDHGNAIGEWGVYGHPPGMPHDCLRVVPWIETSATDSGTYEPELEPQTDSQVDRDEQLAALGYV